MIRIDRIQDKEYCLLSLLSNNIPHLLARRRVRRRVRRNFSEGWETLVKAG